MLSTVSSSVVRKRTFCVEFEQHLAARGRALVEVSSSAICSAPRIGCVQPTVRPQLHRSQADALDGVQGSAEEEAPISDAIEVYHQYGFADGQLTASRRALGIPRPRSWGTVTETSSSWPNGYGPESRCRSTNSGSPSPTGSWSDVPASLPLSAIH